MITKEIRIILLGLFMTIAFFPLYAQENNQPEQALLTVGNDTLRAEIQSAFDAFRGPLYNDPGLPAFTLVSKNKRFAAGIGGYVRFTTAFDFAGSIPASDFITSLIPIGSGYQRSRLKFEATTSKVFLRVLADLPIGLLNLYVETDFRASENRNRLSFAYATLGGWRVGRYWSLITDLGAFPPSIDFQGPNAFAGTFTYQLSYTGNINKNFSYGISLELPTFGLSDTLQSMKMPQRIPTMPLYLKYADIFGHLRLGTLLRPLVYKNSLDGNTEYAFTTLALLTGCIKPDPRMNIYLTGLYGSGTGTYSFDLYGLGLDLLPDPGHPGKLRPGSFYGGYVGLDYTFSRLFKASATYSRLHYLKNKLNDPSLYRFTEYFILTGYFQVMPKMQVAVEYDWGSRSLHDKSRGEANRVMAMIRYDF
ncbi:MAG: hypothetical protein ACRCSQ_08025 [Bacteroidales bacterium]